MNFKNLKAGLNTPAYYFDLDEFKSQVNKVKSILKDIPLTYSIKANPFLLFDLPKNLKYVEVCSPGELKICKKAEIPGSKIIYSGVNKEEVDILESLEYKAEILTAESLKHLQIEQNLCSKLNIKQKVILRLTSGNQFGMSKEDIFEILSNQSKYQNIEFYGIHYYSGTQKKTKNIKKDFEYLDDFLKEIKAKFDFEIKLLEYGPGLAIDYFSSDFEEKEDNYLSQLEEILKEYENYPIGIEMGRFLASSCGTYATKVMDIKENNNTKYAIIDGGVHHIKYYGQTMAMKIPQMKVYNSDLQDNENYCICGSLCTVADVLVREVELPKLKENDIILFMRCGAYSITENSALFLSRNMPKVFLYDEKIGLKLVRDEIKTWEFNY